MENDIHQLADQARNSLGSFCMQVCTAQCCRRGYLSLRKDEISTVTGNREEQLRKEEQVIDTSDGRTLLQLDHGNGPCPSLCENLCLIYRHGKRPQVCHDYPLFVFNKTVVVASDCLGVQQGRLDAALKEMEARGYRII